MSCKVHKITPDGNGYLVRSAAEIERNRVDATSGATPRGSSHDETWNLTRHKIAPDVDFDRADLLQDLLMSGFLERYGYIEGVGQRRYPRRARALPAIPTTPTDCVP